MNKDTLLVRSAAVLAAGGLAWLAKMAVIAATDGAVTDGASAAGAFYLLGVALMAAGLAGVAIALTAGRHTAVRALAAIAGTIGFFVSYVVIEGIAKSVAGDAGPSWMAEEVGILATGAVLAATGLLIARAGGRRSRALPDAV